MATAEENYKRLSNELDKRLKADKRLAAIADKISKGKADFTDTEKYSHIVSQYMGEVISEYIGEITMPLGKEYVCKALLREHYDRINDVLGEVQASVDDKLGIHLNPIKAPFPTERVDKAAHSLEDPTVPKETIERRAKSVTENCAESMHDDYIKENAGWRSQAGLDCYLVRDADGGCCKWCQALDGKYPYATAPDDIFRRHDNCKCNVTYICGKKRQQVWSKQDWSNNKEREYLKRLDAEKAAKRKALSDNSKPKVNSKEQAEAINEPSKNNITVLSKEQAEAINEQNQPIVLTEAEAKEREAMALGKDDNVNNQSLDKPEESGIIKGKESTVLVIDMQFFANKNIPKMESQQLSKSIKSWNEQIEIHKNKIASPEKYYENWDKLDERYKSGLKKHWEHEIKAFSNDIQAATDELKKRGE